MKSTLAILIALLFSHAALAADPRGLSPVKPPPPELKVPGFYKKYLEADGYPIVASERVNDYALREAAYLVNLMLAKRPDVRAAMIKSGSRLCIIAHNEFTTDLPEWTHMTPKAWWDARARGTGGSQDDPFCSCGEENLLSYSGDPYVAENILIHEFAHNIHLRGMVNVDPTFDPRVKAAYDEAMKAGLWKGKYASVNHHEYFAEGVQSWFDNNRVNDHDHNHVHLRSQLLEYDPGLAALCREVFGDTELKYTKPATRLRDHLKGYDPAKAPKFTWPDRLSTVRAEIKKEAQTRSDAASETNSPLLSVKRIFSSGEFGGEGFSGRWMDDSSGYTTFETSEAPGGGRDLVRHLPESGTKEILVPARDFVPPGGSSPLGIDSHSWSKDRSKILIFTNTKKVWRTNSRGDYWVLDRTSHELIKLGGDVPASTLMFAKFSPDGRRVAYVRERNIYVEDLQSRRITALTTNTSPEIINGTFDWVYEEEFALRNGFRWSPDSRSIAYWQLDTEGVREVALVNNTDGLYPKTQLIEYPKTGEMNAAGRVGVVDANGGPTRWLEVLGDPRNHYIFDLEWPEGSTEIFLQQLNRLQNTNRVMFADPATGKVRTLFIDRDAAWVEAHQDLTWLKDGKRFIFLSERDGWDHLYLGSRDDDKLKQATKGKHDVVGLVHVDEGSEQIYYMASPDNPTQRYLYRSRFNGSRAERVTPAGQSGTHSYQISPDGRWAFHTWSSHDVPPMTELISLPDHKSVRVLAENKKLKDRVAALKLPTTEFFKVPVAKDVELDAWCIRPADFDPTKKYPLVIYVYGEPAGSTVRDSWGGDSQLWHHLLAQQGYLVMSFDNRGTATPRGRDWRKSIYRQIGVLASQDQAAALKHVLATRSYVDPARVGIWGWSGGGSMTLNAMLRHPDLYSTGISIASVPNMRLYDTIYQERYMGLPDDNVEGYRNGSPLTFASQLKGNLLLIHGTGDDNCHYQGVEALVNEFIRHGRQFRMMSYPNRSHSINEGTGTTLHLRELMTSYLKENLPPGPR